VVMTSGMIGKVVRVEDTEIGVEIAQGVTVKVIKSMIADIRTKGEPAPANDAKV
jgi:preprotein translocase subunit YajC